MTGVLVVHHDIDLSDQEVDSLRRFGYTVQQCTGPMRNSCPIFDGQTCELAEAADVLVYDAWAAGEPDGSEDLITKLRELHPDKPIVLTSSGFEPDWVETTGAHNVTPLVGRPTGARLHAAIQDALGRTSPAADPAGDAPGPGSGGPGPA